MSMNKSATYVRLQQLTQVLEQMLSFSQPADVVLSQWFRSQSKAGSRDRAQIAEAVFDVLRNLRLYRQLALGGTGSNTRRLAILGLAKVLERAQLDTGLSVAERAWLEDALGFDGLQSLPFAIRYSWPDWLAQQVQLVPKYQDLVQALHQSADLDVRVNPLKTSRDDILAVWQQGPEARWQPQAMSYSPWGIRLRGRPPINRWTAFERGEIEVQDEGSQLLAALVAPRRGEMVIDYCAGAGGKTLLLGALMRSSGRLYAFDIAAARLARAKPRFARSGLSNITPVVISAENDQRVKRLRAKAHRVLVDAPCSGLGTLRRNPDLKWRQQPKTIQQLCQTQASILRQAASCVRPGGRLVYATCSILPEENQDQVQAFLAAHSNFSLTNAAAVLAERGIEISMADDYLVLRPDVHGTDGFFAAVLQREP